MIVDKLKPYILVAGMGLAGILGANTANAAEPAQTNQENQETFLGRPITEQQKEGLRMLPVIPEYFLAYFLLEPFIHESGHALAGTALGVHVKEFHPYPGKGAGGYTSFNVTKESWEKTPEIKRDLINLAGIVSARAAAEGLDALMNNIDMNPYAEQMLAATYFTMRIEVIRYALLTMGQCWGRTSPWTGSDIHNIARMFTKDPGKQKWVYAGILGLSAIDLALDWDEMSDNWRRMFMLDYNKKKEAKGYSINVASANGGVQASFTYNF